MCIKLIVYTFGHIRSEKLFNSNVINNGSTSRVILHTTTMNIIQRLQVYCLWCRCHEHIKLFKLSTRASNTKRDRLNWTFFNGYFSIVLLHVYLVVLWGSFHLVFTLILLAQLGRLISCLGLHLVLILNLSYQALGACFRPYRDFFSL